MVTTGSIARPLTFALLLSASIAACSGQTAPGSGSGTNPNDYSGAIGPIDIPAGVETTQCIVVPLGNTEDVVVTGVDVNLSAGSHHLIVYTTTAAEQRDPVNCSPFTGLAIGTDSPIFFANKQQASFAFPDGVAVEVPAHQMVKIEGHYINTTQGGLQGTGVVTLHTVPKASAPPYQAANFLFWGTTNISIPPNSSYSTGPLFNVGPAGAHLMLVTTHQHRLGTRAQGWASSGPGDMSNKIADDNDWSNPSWKMLTPTIDFNGTNGLTYQCDWTNTTDKTVSFGESALDEMCFVGGYYYPSTGIDVCFDGRCHTR